MKKRIIKWTLRITAALVLLLGILIGIVLNPTLLYAYKTRDGNFIIYHQIRLDHHFNYQLDKANEWLKTSELYDKNYQLDICLNDGSSYPHLMEKLRGPAFGWGFANKVVLMGEANCRDNYVELNGYKWNLSQLLAHEGTHCLQFHRFGFWKSNPMGSYPNWKWEGYPEYVARRNEEQLDLAKNIERKITAETTDPDGWAIYFNDSTIAPRDYYNAWILVQYCLDVKKMTYESLLNDTTSEQTATKQMMKWFEKQKCR